MPGYPIECWCCETKRISAASSAGIAKRNEFLLSIRKHNEKHPPEKSSKMTIFPMIFPEAPILTNKHMMIFPRKNHQKVMIFPGASGNDFSGKVMVLRNETRSCTHMHMQAIALQSLSLRGSKSRTISNLRGRVWWFGVDWAIRVLWL
jgi:hypothetical protein